MSKKDGCFKNYNTSSNLAPLNLIECGFVRFRFFALLFRLNYLFS